MFTSGRRIDKRAVNDRCPTILATTTRRIVTLMRIPSGSVDVRIAVNHSPREVTVEVPDDERDDVNAKIEAALSGADEVLWLVDKRGRRVGVPSANIAYIEVGTPDGDRRIGFGG